MIEAPRSLVDEVKRFRTSGDIKQQTVEEAAYYKKRKEEFILMSRQASEDFETFRDLILPGFEEIATSEILNIGDEPFTVQPFVVDFAPRVYEESGIITLGQIAIMWGNPQFTGFHNPKYKESDYYDYLNARELLKRGEASEKEVEIASQKVADLSFSHIVVRNIHAIQANFVPNLVDGTVVTQLELAPRYRGVSYGPLFTRDEVGSDRFLYELSKRLDFRTDSLVFYTTLKDYYERESDKALIATHGPYPRI